MLPCRASQGGGTDAPEAIKDLREALAEVVKQAQMLTAWVYRQADHYDSPLGHAEALANHLRQEAPDTVRRVCDALLSGHASDLSLILGRC